MFSYQQPTRTMTSTFSFTDNDGNNNNDKKQCSRNRQSLNNLLFEPTRHSSVHPSDKRNSAWPVPSSIQMRRRNAGAACSVSEEEDKDDEEEDPWTATMIDPTPLGDTGIVVVSAAGMTRMSRVLEEDEGFSEHLQSLVANNNNYYSARQHHHRRTLSSLLDVDFDKDFDKCFDKANQDDFMSAMEDDSEENDRSNNNCNDVIEFQQRNNNDQNHQVKTPPKSFGESLTPVRSLSPFGGAETRPQEEQENQEEKDENHTDDDGDDDEEQEVYDGASGSGGGPVKQCVQWNMRYTELCHFKNEHGHCSVPYNYQENPRLAQWVKRQRHQMKRKLEGKHSNLSPVREQKLTELGFIWNAHKASWDQYFHQLVDFKERFGHCNVPTKFPENPQLAVWVKLQRRQFRLMKKSAKLLEGTGSSGGGSRGNGRSSVAVSSANSCSIMTHDRVACLEGLGFVWNPRNLNF